MFGIRENHSGTHSTGSPLPLAGIIKDILFPLRCLDCGSRISPWPAQEPEQEPARLPLLSDSGLFSRVMARCFCGRCRETDVHPLEPPFCSRCAVPFHTLDPGLHLCQDCMEKDSPVGKVRAFSGYEGLIRTAIHRFKYGRNMALADPLGMLLFAVYDRYFPPGSIDLLVPLPLHRSTMKKRGFNQAHLLIRRFRAWSLTRGDGSLPEMDPSVVIRVRKTPTQTGLDRQAREKNVRGAFRVVKPERVRGQRLLLVDDVYTTGATSRGAASVLLNAGALTVDVLVLARA